MAIDRTPGLANYAPGMPQEWLDRLTPLPIVGAGAIRLPNIGVTGTAIGAGWVPLDEASVVEFTPQHCVMNPAGPGTFAFGLEGIWQISVYITFAHEELNAGRTTNVRVFNVTDNVQQGTASPVFIARNQPGSTFSITGLVPVVDIASIYRLEIGGGDTITSPVYDAQNIDLVLVSSVI